MLVENVGWRVPLDVYDSGTLLLCSLLLLVVVVGLGLASLSASRVRGFQSHGVDT